MNRLTTYISIIILAVALVGCDVHEFPETEDPDGGNALSLYLEFDLSLPLFKDMEYSTDRGLFTRAGSHSEYSLRYIVQAFPAETRDGGRVPLRSWTFTRTRADYPDTTLTLDIPAGTARLLIWADVSDADGNDLHYLTSDFSEIRLPDRSAHRGGTELRQAFRGDMSLAGGETAVTVRMERPMAKYRFVTNDFDRFISDVVRNRGSESAEEDSPDMSRDLSDYYVRFLYPRFMACSFNMFTNRPADSWAGVTYTTAIHQLSATEAEMGFDYVFVNSHETSVNVGLEVVERSTGQTVARVPSLEVPLSRSKLTTVRGPFLTTRAEGGAGINPDFEGDFDILIE